MDMNATLSSPVKVSVAKATISLFVISTIMAACVCVLNPLMIVAIVKTPSLRRCHSNIFLINLAVVDLLIMVLVLVFITKNWLGLHNKVLCILGVVYFGTVSIASMLFCFAIAVDRFLFIHKALTYSTLVTHARVLKVVGSIWVVSLVNACISMTDGRMFAHDCEFEVSVAISVNSTITLLMFCVTCIISICLYTKLFFVIRDHNKVLEIHALAHCRTHNCSNHACRVTTRLGECRFRHDSHSSSFTSTVGEGRSSCDHTENKRLVSHHRTSSSAASFTSGLNTTCSMVFFQDGTSAVPAVNPLPNQATGRRSAVQSQNLIDNDHSNVCRSEDRNQTSDFVKEEPQPAVVSGSKRKTSFGRCQHLRDLRTIKTLMMMFATYFICWAPLMALKLSHHIFHKQVSEQWTNSAWVSAMSNSVWNFVVYPLRKKDLRDVMLKMLRRCLGLQTYHERPRSLRKDGGNESAQSSLKKSSSYASRLS